MAAAEAVTQAVANARGMAALARSAPARRALRGVVVAGAVLLLASCAGAPPRDGATPAPAASAEASSDDLATRISDALRHAPGIEFWQVRVQVLHDTVYLYGLVETNPERANIEQVARDTAGGRKVVNAIEVRGRY